MIDPDYDLLSEQVLDNDHELLALDTLLKEALGKDPEDTDEDGD